MTQTDTIALARQHVKRTQTLVDNLLSSDFSRLQALSDHELRKKLDKLRRDLCLVLNLDEFRKFMRMSLPIRYTPTEIYLALDEHGHTIENVIKTLSILRELKHIQRLLEQRWVTDTGKVAFFWRDDESARGKK
jgi:hypothetical protein